MSGPPHAFDTCCITGRGDYVTGVTFYCGSPVSRPHNTCSYPTETSSGMATDPVCIEDFKKIAEAKLSKYVREYYNSGANYEDTYRDNTDAFGR